VNAAPNENKTCHVPVWLAPEMALVLKRLALRDRRKVSAYVRMVLERHIAVRRDT
jgi:predicted DNA-binding protein